MDSPAYTLVALDLDGTTIRRDGTVSPRLKAAVSECLARHIHVILATGRMPQSAYKFWRELGLPPGPLVAYQGATVVQMPQGRTLAKITLPHEGAREAVEWAIAHNVLTQVYVAEELWVSREDPRVRDYIEQNHIPAWVRGPLEIIDWPEPPVKVLLQGESGLLDSLRGELESLVSSHPIRIFKSQSDYLELVNKEVGKSTGLRTATKMLGILQERVFAIGDAENDIDMLKWAGWGVAMGQALAQVKAAADAVTAAVDEDGAAIALERWVLGKAVD